MYWYSALQKMPVWKFNVVIFTFYDILSEDFDSSMSIPYIMIYVCQVLIVTFQRALICSDENFYLQFSF